VIKRRTQDQGLPMKSSAARGCIVEGIVSIVENQCLPRGCRTFQPGTQISSRVV
jgi:hypothetical protein